LLERNAAIFKEQGKALNDFASPDVKVLVVGNPANTNAFIAMCCAPDIPKENFTALTRLDLNRAKAQVVKKINSSGKSRISVADVHNVTIWGNHSNTQFPDVAHGYLSNYPRRGFAHSIREAINDDEWIHKVFVPAVQERGALVIKTRQKSSAASASIAIIDHLRNWLLGTAEGETVSMGVISDGSYGVAEGIIYSFPVICSNGSYSIVQDLSIDAKARKMMEISQNELLQERADAAAILGFKI